jgi:WD40 repeat protein
MQSLPDTKNSVNTSEVSDILVVSVFFSNFFVSNYRCNSVVRQVTFSPSGNCLVYVCEDGTVWLWSINVV